MSVNSHVEESLGPEEKAYKADLVQRLERSEPSDTSEEPSPPWAPDQLIEEKYVVKGVVGSGAMGIVYEAQDVKLGRKIALKQIRRQRERLVREAQSLAKLNHPNVVCIHEVFTTDKDAVIAMEFVDGSTLLTWPQNTSWRKTLEILVGVARGVAAAHEQGLVHRDLKPANVMLGTDNRPRVMDFGLARWNMQAADPMEAAVTLRLGRKSTALDPRQELTRTGELLGTPGYMAPEQWNNTGVGPKTDQYAWCVIAWELLFHESPIPGKTLHELRAATIGGQRRPAPRKSAVPRWLRRVLERGLSVEPDRRWANMGELLAVLERGQRRDPRFLWRGASFVLAGALVAGLVMHDSAPIGASPATVVPGDPWEGIWDVKSIDAVRSGFLNNAPADGFAEHTWAQVENIVDRYVSQWRVLSDGLGQHGSDAERRRVCLDDRKEELHAYLKALKVAGSAAAIHAISGAAELTPLDRCSTMPAVVDPKHARWLREITAMRQVGRFADALHEVELLAGPGDRALRPQEPDERPSGFWSVAQGLFRHGDDPSLVAQVLFLRGTLLRALGRFSAAEESLRQAFHQGIKLRDDPFTAEAGITWLEVLGGDLMQLDEAGEDLRLVENFVERAGSSPLQSARLRRLSASFRGLEGSYLDAVRLLQSLREELDLLGDDAEPERIETLIFLADMARRAGDPPLALPIIDEARHRWIALYGEEHPGIARIYLSRGQILAGLPGVPYPNIIAELELARDFAEASGATHLIGAVHNDLHQTGTFCESRRSPTEDCKQSMEHVEEGLLALREAYGSSHPKVAIALGNSAKNNYVLIGEFEQARVRLESAVNILARTVGTRHPIYAFWLSELGWFYADQGELTRALPLVAEAEEITRDRRGHSIDLSQRLVRSGLVHWKAGNFDVAETKCAESLQITRELEPEEGHYSSIARECLGLVRIMRGDHAQGLVELDLALDFLVGLPLRLDPPQTDTFQEYIEELKLWRAYTLRQLGREAEAQDLRNDVLQAFDRAGRADLLAKVMRTAKALGVSL